MEILGFLYQFLLVAFYSVCFLALAAVMLFLLLASFAWMVEFFKKIHHRLS